ncbi:hypothetical protein HOD08_03510, partial [bacterium]|nr:hypothetical protein [bacterium]
LQKLPSGMSTLEDLLVLKLGDRPPTYVNHKAHEIINCNKPAIQMPDEDGATMLGFPVGVRMFLHRLQTNRSFFDEMRHKVKSIHLRGNIEALVSKETVCIITAITDMISHRNIDLQRPNNPESSIRSAPPGPGGSWR